jgi:hypothetical protein
MKNYNPSSTAAILDQRRFTYSNSTYDTATKIDSPDRTADTVQTAFNACTLQVTSAEKATNSNVYTKYAYTYHARTALMKTGTVSDKTTSAGTYTQRAKFTYAYDNRGLSTRVERQYGTSAAITTTKTFSPGGTFILQETNHAGNVQKYYYTDRGQLDTVNYVGLDIMLVGVYDDAGRLIMIDMRSNTYANPAQANNIMARDNFDYTNGLLTTRYLEVLIAPPDVTNVYQCDISYEQKGNIDTVTHYKQQSAAGALTSIEKTYTYTKAFMSLATSVREVADHNGNMVSTNTKTYSYKEGMLFNAVKNSNTSVEQNLVYTYAGDRMSRFQVGSSASDVRADYYGNQTTAPNLSVNYTYELDGCLRTAQRATTSTYRYEPGGP